MNRLPKEFDPFELKNCFIAGGSILSVVTKTEIKDYDIYPKSFEGFSDAVHTMKEHSAYVVSITEKAITYICNDIHDRSGCRVTAQIMLFDWFDTAEKIFDYFDFTVCMAAYDCDTKSYIFHEDFYPDVSSNTLRFNYKTKYPLGSLLRVHKYKNKGYNIGKLEHTKIALALAKKGLPNSWDELESQIGGFYGKELSLKTENMEYSFENAIQVLSDMDLDFNSYLENNSEKYSGITPELILACYDTTHDKYIEVDNSRNYFVSDYFVETPFSKMFYEAVGLPNKAKLVENFKLFGFQKKDPYYSTSSCYAKKPTDDKKQYKLVSFDSNHISSISPHNNNNISCKHLSYIKDLPTDTLGEDDIIEHISNILIT